MRAKTSESPYFRLAPADWENRTRELLTEQPLDGPTLVSAVLDAWESIFTSSLGGFTIGRDIFPTPQIMGFLLHELVPLRLASANPDWRRDRSSSEKDLVYLPKERYSIEIKTSSDATSIFGNRIFGLDNPAKRKKAKDGYYAAINFHKWDHRRPEISRIRYGWLDATDWVAQKAESGQQSSLPAAVYNSQLLTVFKR